jgi:hypothetical protein
VSRSYLDGEGRPCVVICWGSAYLRGITPVLESDCKQLASEYEFEARLEANTWLDGQEVVP